MTRTQRVARATAGRPYSAHRAYPQLVGWALPTTALLHIIGFWHWSRPNDG